MRNPTWRLFECDAGRRWASAIEDDAGSICDFSGCGCGTIVRQVGTTTDRDTARAHWGMGTQCGTTHAAWSADA
jgi:hypothetical protein